MSRLPPLPSDAEMEIPTARLRLVPMCGHHADSMFPILSDRALYEFTGDAPPASVEALRELYAWREGRRSPDGQQLWLNWQMREADSEESVGYAQATVHAAHAYVAWVVGTHWQGRGYASEAATSLVRWLTHLGVPEVRACVHPAHVASQRVAARAGLRITAEQIDGEDVWTNRHGAERDDRFQLEGPA